MLLKLKLYKGIWYYEGTVAGERLRGSTRIPKEHKKLAQRAVAKIERRTLERSIDGPQSVLTFAQAALSYRAAGKSDRFLTKVEDYFKDTLVKEINSGMIRQMAIETYPGCSGASLNRMGIVPAQAVINHAAESELCDPIRVRRFKVDAKIKEPATLEWVQAMQAHGSSAIGGLALFMYLTGARIGEAIGLQWDDVDLTQGTALIRQSKVGAEHIAHLPTPLIVALANIPRKPGRGVFFYKHPTDITKAWNKAIKKAKIKKLSPHCCRHGFATGLLRSGLDVHTVAKLGGWKGPSQVLKTYGHAIENRKLTDVLVKPLTNDDGAHARKPMKTGTT